ncbi:hypothetical protein GOBAR_AA09161 [Gossypium barbadense]|uniref:Uncharacterized protein n=1 Tax=Gossypium barbadense TaxID=3634 RepID=A0A2P5Y7F1_GOSBA|nr:hypothetical protein GOBAR_AA09161 [Gossypium barbadense]
MKACFDDPGTIQFHLGGLVHQLNVPEFGIALNALAPGAASYNPSRSKASALPPSLRYLHAILAHTLTRRRESTGIYRFAQSTEEEAPKDITDDVPPRHEDPPSQPLPPSHLVHAVASYADISESLTRFEQQCFQCFDHIEATLNQIFQQFHISSPPPPREPSSDEDV